MSVGIFRWAALRRAEFKIAAGNLGGWETLFPPILNSARRSPDETMLLEIDRRGWD
jgi:hypothetical protein